MWQEYKQNLHVHTRYCDGKDTPEELVLQAIGMGFQGLGFSPHSYTPWDSRHDAFLASGEKIDFSMMPYGPDLHMWPEYAGKFQQEVRELKEKYRDRLHIFCGLEWDMSAPCDLSGYDYIIGSCHFLKIGEEIVNYDEGVIPVDGEMVPSTKRVIDKYFDGDAMEFVKKYYENFVEFQKDTKIDIVGHFDCITNYCEKYHLFDETSKEYRDIALEALHAVAEKTKIFEVNTGVLLSGRRRLPNPSPFLLKELKKLGGSLLITSDCHDKQFLQYGFELATEVIRACGFEEIMILTDEGFRGIRL